MNSFARLSSRSAFDELHKGGARISKRFFEEENDLSDEYPKTEELGNGTAIIKVLAPNVCEVTLVLQSSNAKSEHARIEKIRSKHLRQGR